MLDYGLVSRDKTGYSWNTYKLTVNIIFFFWSCPTVSAIDCKNNEVIKGD